MRPLYCFPPAGGGAGLFETWAGHLPAGVETRMVRYSTGGDPGGSVQDLAAAAAALVASRQEQPAGFVGHSLGALVAFECLRLLQRTGGARPPILYVAGHVAPHLPSPGPDLHRLGSADFWAEVGALGGTPPELLADPELKAAVEPRVRSEFRAAETYRFERGWPLDCDLMALAGAADTQAPAAAAAAWRMHTTGGFEHTVVPGGHFFPFQPEPSRQETLRIIRERLPVVTSAL